MISEKQKEALKAVLELHREDKITDAQVLTIIEALIEGTQNRLYVPLVTEVTSMEPIKPLY